MDSQVSRDDWEDIKAIITLCAATIVTLGMFCVAVVLTAQHAILALVLYVIIFIINISEIAFLVFMCLKGK